MTEPSGPPEFADVNEAVLEEWEAETTPYERVREVISHTYTGVSAANLAETARTSPKTARKHLDALAAEGFVATEPGENGATHYRRSPESLVLEQARDILDGVSTDELTDRVRQLRERDRELREQFGAESPAAVTVEQTNRALSGGASDTPDPATLDEWRRVRRNLAFANAALSIATAKQFVDADPSDESVPAG